mmetsp:Transcript_41950/g.48277  ORF Transcript_41950/g.48277 Transcript_41950/m.48277 type:complete len:253 (-) Transcript_41950:177-935(-)
MDTSAEKTKKMIMLFDVDGTLTVPQNKITSEMLEFMQKSQQKVDIGVVGGSAYAKIASQVGADYLKALPYAFTENGLVWMKGGEWQKSVSIKDKFTESELNAFISFCLRYIGELDIPIKRGTFVDFRTGMMNISPIGRNCSQEERDEFERYDKEHQIRATMIQAIKDKFPDLGLVYSIGGQISFDVFPEGWDKRFCLQYLEEYETIHFFGDKTFAGGNDHEIYACDRTIGHSVKSPEDTRKIMEDIFAEHGL